MDQLDQLHAVSDLHLGGAPGRQIFDQGQLLAGTIDRLRERAPDARVGLVLNGDIVDFLAAPGATYLDPFGAVTKLDAILTDAAFRPVWEALARFVRAPNRTLTLGLGNHDVELALPDVQEHLLHAICGDSLEARARVRVAMDGSGYSCVVGARRVLCVHGNEVDAWNVVDQGALNRVICSLRQESAVPPWDPNAGTRLVIDVMNDIKRSFPMVDLLKPETRPLVGVLLALDPSSFKALKRFAPIAARLGRQRLRAADEIIGDGSQSGIHARPFVDRQDAALHQSLGPRARQLNVKRPEPEIDRDRAIHGVQDGRGAAGKAAPPQLVRRAFAHRQAFDVVGSFAGDASVGAALPQRGT